MTFLQNVYKVKRRKKSFFFLGKSDIFTHEIPNGAQFVSEYIKKKKLVGAKRHIGCFSIA